MVACVSSRAAAAAPMGGAEIGTTVPLGVSVGAVTLATGALDTIGELAGITATVNEVAGDVDAPVLLAREVDALVAFGTLDESIGAVPTESPQAEIMATNSRVVRCLNVAVVKPMNSSFAN